MKLFEKNDRGQLEPERLWNRMNAEDQASVTTLAKNVEPYYSSMSGAPFFPEYTLHGIEHVRNVISFANKLIPDPTPDSLTSGEIAYLFSAIMIHDIGMFLTEDGFKSLVEGAYSDNQIPGLDSASWNSEWNTYIERVRRYPDTKLINLLGDDTPVESVCLDPDRMQKRDRLVCGDFLRIYHGRLAHQIAIKKFMGTRDVDIFCNTSFDDEDRDLIGLIARSHCVNMRDTESYLNSLFGEVERPRNARIFYLMSLLRIADYIDAGKNRAPEALTYRQEITSPISRNEWEWNNQIKERSYTWNFKRKRLNIDASPSTTSQFVMVEKWLKSIQTELDMSWAFLHEKYPEDCPPLSIHRITSRLLQDKCRETYKKKFVINDMRLHVNPSILRLLIAPLYGNNPSFGVRELLQNAVDACREREYLKQDDKYKGEVTVSIDTNDETFIITDNGIGMTEEVLRDYFLSIGSSYRESDEWKQNYTVNLKSKVARTGKFGIGVLSAFLLGDSINVTSRSVNDSLGYQFDFAMETSCIDIKRVRADIGTTITIQLNSASLKKLSEERPGGWTSEADICSRHLNSIMWYEWYHFSKPIVRYYINCDEVNIISTRPVLPDVKQCNTWYSLDNNEYESYFWSFNFQHSLEERSQLHWPSRSNSTILFCNGIPVELSSDCIKCVRPFDFPAISIVDNQGSLAFNLSRSKLQSIPYSSGLKHEISKYVLSQIINHEFSSFDDLFFYPRGLHGLYETERNHLDDNAFVFNSLYFISKGRFIPSFIPFSSAASLIGYIQIGYNTMGFSFSDDPEEMCNSQQILDFYIDYSKISPLPLLPCVTTERLIRSNRFCDGLINRSFRSNRAFFAFRSLSSAVPTHGRLPHYVKQAFVGRCHYHIDEYFDYIIYASDSQALALSKYILKDIATHNVRPSFVRLVPKSDVYAPMGPIDCKELSDLSQDILGADAWIPFDLEARRQLFSKAFSVLSDYL